MEKRVDQSEASVASISAELKNIGELIGAGFKKVDTNFDSIGREIKQLHGEIAVLNKKVDLLKGETTDGLEDVGLKLENLTEEISKIGTVTRYGEEFKNMQAIK